MELLVERADVKGLVEWARKDGQIINKGRGNRRWKGFREARRRGGGRKG